MMKCRTASPKRMCRDRRAAFTILEMLVVIFVIAVLTSLLIPSLAKARNAARTTVCVAHLKQIGAAVFTYAFDADDRAPAVMKRAGTTAPRSLLSRTGRYVNLGLLIETGITEDPSIFYCPSQKQFWYGSDPSYLPQATIAGSYAYAVHVRAGKSPQVARLRHLALISDDFTGRRGASGGIGQHSHKVGYNVLYTDGSASWYNDADESIWKRAVRWDDERDDVNYDTLYRGGSTEDDGGYGSSLDIFRVWRSFCYNSPDPF